MNKYTMMSLSAAALLACAGCSTTSSQPPQSGIQGTANVTCRMSFHLTGWAIIASHARGEGTVNCDNGQSMPVKITANGGGLTAGKWHVDDGKGKFSKVSQIGDVLGSYAEGNAHAGVVGSAQASALTKGEVSLALSGTGQGINLGVGVSKFTISRK